MIQAQVSWVPLCVLITTTPSHHPVLKKDKILELEKIFYGIELTHC